MKLSIIVPVYNEAQTIAGVLNKLLSVKLPCEREIIVVNDGSTDGSEKEIQTFVKKNRQIIRLITHQINAGKGTAVKTGMKQTRGEYVLIQDADLEYNPEEIPLLLKPVLKEMSANISVYGSRFLRKDVEIPGLYFLGNKFLTLLTNIIYGTKLSDMETGYKLIPGKFIRSVQINSSHFDFEPEVTAKLVRAGIRIVEVPITYKGRSHVAGKKLTTMDAFEAIKALLYYRFFP